MVLTQYLVACLTANENELKRTATAARKSPATAFALALAGDLPQSRALAEVLAREFPEDTSVQFMYLPTLRGLFSLNTPAPDALAAIQALQTASRYNLALGRVGFVGRFGGLYPIYVRGLAYLAARQPAEAAAELTYGFSAKHGQNTRDCRKRRIALPAHPRKAGASRIRRRVAAAPPGVVRHLRDGTSGVSRSTPPSSRLMSPAAALNCSRILRRRWTSLPRRVRSTRRCRLVRVLRSTYSARLVSGVLVRGVLLPRGPWPACEWRLPCPISWSMAAKWIFAALLQKTRWTPAGRKPHTTAGPDAAAGRRCGSFGRITARGRVAHVEIRHTASSIDLDFAAPQKHRFELFAGALHA